MNPPSDSAASVPPPLPPAAPTAAIWTLLLLAPVFTELLSGSVRLTTIAVLIPTTGFWGGGALLIREVARRRGGRWTVLLLGLALAVFEECLVQQTSLAPLIGTDLAHPYARAFGVNWVYLVWSLGFETVWAVVLPISLVDIVYPSRRAEPWLTPIGILIAAIAFTASAFVAWFSWREMLVPQLYPAYVYRPPLAALALALLAIGALITAAVFLPKSPTSPSSSRPPPSPATLLIFAALLVLPWQLQPLLAFGAWPHWPVAPTLLAALALAALALVALRSWSARPGWGDAHRLALIFGLTVSTMIGGALALPMARALWLDRIAQLVFCLAALGWLIQLARRHAAAR